MKKKITPKAQRERLHAKRRAELRYGVILNREKYASVIEQIKTGKWINRKKSSNNRWLYIIDVDGEETLVVYDKKRQELVTVLPKDSYLFSTVKES